MTATGPNDPPPQPAPPGRTKPASPQAPDPGELRARLQKLATPDDDRSWHLGAWVRSAFLTGLLIVGPVTLTIYIVWSLVQIVDERVKSFIPATYHPDTYLPIHVPGIGLLICIIGLTLIGGLAANLIGRTVLALGEIMLGRMPIVRNVYRGLQQIFESIITASGPKGGMQRVGLIEFPSTGLWSLVFVTGETSGEIAAVAPGGEADLLNVWVPTGIVPPTGFVCFLPRKNVILLEMTIEEAAKIIVSGGMVMPATIERARAVAKPVPPTKPS